MSIEKDDLELLMNRVELMRDRQNQYFHTRNTVDLRYSKAAEGNVDELLKQLRKRGYDPGRFANKTEQKNLGI